MKHLFLTDPVEGFKLKKDSSYKLMIGAAILKHKVFYAQFSDMFFQQKLNIDAQELDLSSEKIKALKKQTYLADDFDFIWVRKDPPFDDEYLYATILLEHCKKAKVINSPEALRRWNEKLSLLYYPEFSPKTLIAKSISAVESFVTQKQGRYVLKPLDGFAGRGIAFINTDNSGWKEEVIKYLKRYDAPIVVQEYLEKASEGDKRVLIWKGKALGAILRIHAEGSEINNLDAGGKAVPTKISAKEQKIIDSLAKDLVKSGLDFVGLDFLDEHLTEINVTSPTGLQELCNFSDIDHHINIMRSLETI